MVKIVQSKNHNDDGNTPLNDTKTNEKRIKRTRARHDHTQAGHEASRRQTGRVLCYIEFEENNQEYSLSPVPTTETGRASRWSYPRRAPRVQCGRFGVLAAAPTRCPYKWSHSPRTVPPYYRRRIKYYAETRVNNAIIIIIMTSSH